MSIDTSVAVTPTLPDDPDRALMTAFLSSVLGATIAASVVWTPPSSMLRDPATPQSVAAEAD
jgi:hypothetical protein